MSSFKQSNCKMMGALSENQEALFQPHSAALRRSQCSGSWLDMAREIALPVIPAHSGLYILKVPVVLT